MDARKVEVNIYLKEDIPYMGAKLLVDMPVLPGFICIEDRYHEGKVCYIKLDSIFCILMSTQDVDEVILNVKQASRTETFTKEKAYF